MYENEKTAELYDDEENRQSLYDDVNEDESFKNSELWFLNCDLSEICIIKGTPDLLGREYEA